MTDYGQALRHYGKIRRTSEIWLQSIFEGAWTFFLMDKPNNTLGLIHTLLSPFFNDRFYPEAHILQAISYVKMCRYEEAKDALKYFRKTYDDVKKTLKAF